METIHKTAIDKYIQVNDVTICYNDIGKSKIPIIFIHGFPFDKSSWNPQMDFFRDMFRVIAYDIRGFGKSTPGKEDESIRLFADDLINFMDAMKIEKAILCGLSMGGYILLNAISRFPKRFVSIVLSDTQCITDSEEGKQKRHEAISHINAGGFPSFAEGFIKKIFCTDSLNSKTELVERIKQTILSTSAKSVTKTLNALAQRSNTCDSLSSISIPALIICGNEDIVTPPIQSVFLNNAIPNSKLHLIDKAGHMSNLEQPDEFNNLLSKFLLTFINQ